MAALKIRLRNKVETEVAIGKPTRFALEFEVVAFTADDGASVGNPSGSFTVDSLDAESAAALVVGSEYACPISGVKLT